MTTRILLFILWFGVWSLLTWKPDMKQLVIGFFMAIFVTVMTQDMFTKHPNFRKNPWRYLWFMYYVVVFLWECLKANIDVAYRVLHPDLPIRPGTIRVKTSLKSDAGLTFLANSITLTPGTMCVDIDKEKGVLYIHWINVRTTDVEDATKMIAGKFERIIKEIFE